MASKRKNKKSRRSKQMRKLLEAGGHHCVEFFRNLASSQQWREHGTLPPLSNDEALILNDMYQAWLSQTPEEKDTLRNPCETLQLGNDGYHGQHLTDTLQHNSLLSLPPLLSPNASGDFCEDIGGDILPSSTSYAQQHDGLGDCETSHSVSVGLCITTIRNSVTQHVQHSDSLLNLVNQLDVLMKAPEPTRTHANDLVVMLLSPDFIHRDIAALEHRIDIANNSNDESCEEVRGQKIHLAVATACCILLALLAESEHLITDRYRTSLPEPFQELIEQEKNNSNHSRDLKQLFDDIATSYYLRSLTIAKTGSPGHSHLNKAMKESANGLTGVGDVHGSSSLSAAEGCAGRNSIAAMQLGSKYLRGGVECSALVPPPGRQGHEEAVAFCERQYHQAYQWFLQAALLENPVAQHKVGYFYDEGLPYGACEVHIMEAVKWYSRAAELMPDSMHNLAKIYEDGRGGFDADLSQAVTLYSVAAARGFPLSQVNLGRLFLLGEDGVQRDREAGKRLLTLAAESGDADAQMVVGMIHATPAFECFDLPLSEHWLSCSLAGGKKEAERLLGRVRQQIQQKQQRIDNSDPPLDVPTTKANELDQDTNFCGDGDHYRSLHQVKNLPPAQQAAAAKQRGEDFLSHNLLHAAVLEFSRAFELDRSCLGYFVDRLEALFLLGHFEECLSDSSLLLECVGVNGEKVGGSKGDSVAFQCNEADMADNAVAMKRLYKVLSNCLSCMHCDRDRDSGVGSDDVGVPENFLCSLPSYHRDAVIRWLLIECMELTVVDPKLLEEGLGPARASAFLAHYTLFDVQGNKSVVRQGGVPMLLAVLSSACNDIRLTVKEFGGKAQGDQKSQTNDVAECERTKKSFMRDQLWLNCLIILQHLLNPPMVVTDHEGENNDEVAPEAAGQDKTLKRHVNDKMMKQCRSVAHLISSVDGFAALTNCAVSCLLLFMNTYADHKIKRIQENKMEENFEKKTKFENVNECEYPSSLHDNEEKDTSMELPQEDVKNSDQLRCCYFRDCIAPRTIMHILHFISTVADSEHLWSELLRGGLVNSFSTVIVSSLLTVQFQLNILCEDHFVEYMQGCEILDSSSDRLQGREHDDEAQTPLPILFKDSSIEVPVVRSSGDHELVHISEHESNRNEVFQLQLQLGHVSVALQHLVQTLQIAEKILMASPLEVLLSLSASDAMNALHQILQLLYLPCCVGQDEENRDRTSINDNITSTPYPEIISSVSKILSPTKQTHSSPSDSVVQLTALLEHFPPEPCGHVLAALFQPATNDLGHKETDCVRDETAGLRSRFKSSAAALDSNISDAVATINDLKKLAASCLCILLCARDPRNGEALRATFTVDRLDRFLVLLNRAIKEL